MTYVRLYYIFLFIDKWLQQRHITSHSNCKITNPNKEKTILCTISYPQKETSCAKTTTYPTMVSYKSTMKSQFSLIKINEI